MTREKQPRGQADDLHDQLEAWGTSKTPRVDGAFANRLETSLRSELLHRANGRDARWFKFFVRPSVVVLGIAVLVFGFALASRAGDGDTGLADGSDPSGATTTNISTEDDAPATTVPGIPGPTVTREPPPGNSGTMTPAPAPDDESPVTTIPGDVTTTDATDSDQTTVPDNSTTTPLETTTVPRSDVPTTTEARVPASIVASLATPTDGQILVRWRVEGDRSEIAGFVVVRTVGDVREIAATLREPGAREARVDIVHRDATFRVEARAAGGAVLAQSEELSISRDG